MDYYLGISLHILSDEEESDVISKLQSIFTCEIHFRKKDEDFVRYWNFEILGMNFNLARFVKDGRVTQYALVMTPTEECTPGNSRKLNDLFLDLHFQRLLINSGFDKVLTDEEYGKYLDEL